MSRLKTSGVKMGLRGFFTLACYSPEGILKWLQRFTNGVTTVGMNYVLNTSFHDTAKSTVWYMGLIRDDNFTALAVTDTMAAHGGWEEADEYDEATRPIWTEGAAAGGVMTNAATVDFTMNDAETIVGAFLVDQNTISGGTGTLYCTGLNDGGDQIVAAADVIKATYTVTVSDQT